jgi:hypothetical protein
MMRVHSSRGLVGCAAIALLAIALVILPGSATAVSAARNEGRLSPRLFLLAKPAVRSGSDRAQAKSLGLPASGPGSLLREGNRVLTEVRFDRGVTAGAADLREEGAKVVDISPRYQVVTAAAKPSELRGLSEVPHVAAVTELFAPIVAAEDDGPLSAAITTPCFGANTSEGDAQLRAAQARAEFGVDGSGVKVGILSDSFDHDLFAPTGAAEDAISGDLPGIGNPCERETPVEVLSDPEKKRDDEGRAMAQIVHDLAPGAELSFATAFKGLPNFAANVEALATAGADVIADDVTYFEEPFFQEGPVGVAVKKVTEAGVSYFSSAGNNNLKNGGRNIASWEAPEYRDANGCPAVIANFSEALEGAGEPGLNPAHCMDFDPGGGFPDRAFTVTVSDGATLVVDLQWAEPWEGVATNLDAFLLGPNGSVVSASLADNVHGSEKPFELVSWENETGAAANVQLVINRFAGSADPRLKFALLENGSGVTSTEYESSAGGDVVGPTIFGHNGAETAISVGAVPYFSEEAPEVYSSRGPVTHYFEPVTGTGPAPQLGSPQLVAKPDIVATDGGANTFFGSCEGGARRFFGTSASAPHAAAVAALMREAEPAASGEAIEEAVEESARPVGLFPATAIGSGLIDAVGAIEKLGVVASEPGAEVAEPPAPGPCLPPREPGDGIQAHAVESPPTPTPPIEPPARLSRPRTFFLRRPAKVVWTVHRRAKVVFLFGSNEPGVSFACRIDGGLFRHCSTRLVRRFPLGWHTVKVAALDSAGNGDKTPASYRFKVKRVR